MENDNSSLGEYDKAFFVNNIDNFSTELEKDISDLINIISNKNPIELLSIFGYKMIYETITEEMNEGYLEYLLAIILALSKPDFPGYKKLVDNEKIKIKDLLGKIFTKSTFLILGKDFQKNSKGKITKKDSEIRYKAILKFLYIRGDTYYSLAKEEFDQQFAGYDQYLSDNYGFNLENINILYVSTYDMLKQFVTHPSINGNSFKINTDQKINQNLLDYFSTTVGSNYSNFTRKESYGYPTNDNIFWEKPILFYKNNYYCFHPRYLLRNIGYILEGLIKNNDNKFYTNKFLKDRANILETNAANCLEKLFHKEVFQNLHYINEDGEDHEIDGLLIYDDNLIIIEAKSSLLNKKAKRGGIDYLKSNFKKTIKKATEQINKAKKYINSSKQILFTDKKGNSLLKLERKDINKIYGINVLSESMDIFTANLYTLEEMGFISNPEDFFWSVYINNLKAIAEIIQTPSEFLSYLTQRIDLNKNKNIECIDELDLFGHFLKYSLIFEEIKGKKLLLITNQTREIDGYYDSGAEKPSLNISPEYRKLIMKIENFDYKGFSNISVGMLEFDEKVMKDIIDLLKLAKRNKDQFFYSVVVNNIGYMFNIINKRNKKKSHIKDDHIKKLKEKSEKIYYLVININRVNDFYLSKLEVLD